MKVKLTNDIICSVKNQIPAMYLSVFKNACLNVMSNYTIQEIESDNRPYNNVLPQAYYDYMNRCSIDGLSKGTIDIYKLRLENFLKSIKKDLYCLTTSDIREYINNYKQVHGIQESTQNSIINVLKSFFSWIFNEGYIDKDPTRNIKLAKAQRIVKATLTSKQLEIVRDNCNSVRDRAIVEFLYSSGVRISELCSLNVNDIDFVSGTFVVLGKGNKERKCFITPVCSFHLQKYLSTRTDNNPALFVGYRNPHRRIKKDGIELIIRKLGRKCNLPFNLTPHVFRRSIATHATQKGLRIEQVKELLGHSSIDITMGYVKMDTNKLKSDYFNKIA